jgi:hypothetical protein
MNARFGSVVSLKLRRSTVLLPSLSVGGGCGEANFALAGRSCFLRVGRSRASHQQIGSTSCPLAGCAGVSRSALLLLHLTAGASRPIQQLRAPCGSQRGRVLVFLPMPFGFFPSVMFPRFDPVGGLAMPAMSVVYLGALWQAARQPMIASSRSAPERPRASGISVFAAGMSG